MSETPRGNVPEYTVGELSGAVKRTLEGAFGRVRVRGEITEAKGYGPNRFYFSMKDPDGGGKLRCVIWAWSAGRSGVKPENGTEVIATGRLTTYPDQSNYQLTVDRLDYAGEGALLAAIEKLRARLLAEGLFDPARKRALPHLPGLIGVISSEKGAVIQDIITTIARRFPRPILLWPVPVQGEGAAARIAAAIEGFARMTPRPDVLIVARGGGSLEDLMAFNDEAVVRAAAASPIPLISAVGHETDTTLIDFASDQRAPTPTAAAELAVPSRMTLLSALQQTEQRLRAAGAQRLDRSRLRLDRAAHGLPDLPGRVQAARQRLDELTGRLARAPASGIAAKRHALQALAPRLPHPRETIADRRSRLTLLQHRQEAAGRRVLDRRRAALDRLPDPGPRIAAALREASARLEGFSARLQGASYTAVLARGFALVRDSAQAPIGAAAAIRPGAALTLVFHDGEAAVTAAGTAPPRKSAAPPPATPRLL
ncbi:exodeoxyribonuclease VII large subunit [Humitalea rosea]|uniref:Exodeoxyribonuclease 7 large subunit n=1 Tax=Humitalea rosea TaxID=990373 RepID=A0A2W7J755_9PROT|nr:exodeoxyribonuclease VII large subunit [Humitalea rosea]PZW47126.1 exodeoxyribonuclease VII large subunit [Humitalea rosea]